LALFFTRAEQAQPQGERINTEFDAVFLDMAKAVDSDTNQPF